MMLRIIIAFVIYILSSLIGSASAQEAICTLQYSPVCGQDSITYGNACTAIRQGATIDYAGTCKTGSNLDQALSMSYQFGITKYDNLTAFQPDSLVTREQIAKMVLQFSKAINKNSYTQIGGFDCGFTDLNTTDPTLTNFITSACQQGIMKGWDQAFHPQDTVSYAQAITMMMRIVGGIQDEPDARWTAYEQYAIDHNYISQVFESVLANITRGELIVLMNIIYTTDIQSINTYEIWDIDDQLVACEGVGSQQCMIIHRNGGSGELFYDSIDGFRYVPGYKYTIQVVGTRIDNPPADASNTSWSMLDLQSYESASNKPDTLPQNGCDWVLIDNDQLSIRGQQCDSNHSNLSIEYDNTLPGVIVSIKEYSVTTHIPTIHLFVFDQSTGLQQLLFKTHDAMIKQGLVSKSQACIFSKNTSVVVGSRVDRYDFITDSALTDGSNCGPYSTSEQGASNYFVKPKDNTTMMIYINNDAQYYPYIDWGSLIIK